VTSSKMIAVSHRRIQQARNSVLNLKHNRPALQWILVILLCSGFFLVYRSFYGSDNRRPNPGHTAVAVDSEGGLHEYNSETSPIIFIGGHPRSGTTLMRAMLDAHSAVRCGEETRVVPRIVQMRENWMKNDNERNRLIQGGMDDRVLCNKDPLTLKSGHYMAELFPKSKWLYMMRDGRAVIHSVISRKVTITGYKLDDPRQCLGRWNTVVTNMDTQCKKIGPSRCMVVYYEQLVLHPQRWMGLILDFLSLPWEDSVLHHEQAINKPGGVRVSIKERSSDQIIKPINLDALTQWVGTFPEDVLKDMDEIAPMLAKFGYDPDANPPNYGVADGVVANNTRDVHEHVEEWEVKSKQLIEGMRKGPLH